ncbi:unnamed protein product [Cylicocyclus nassatus]|uniref:Uncharacterized protein n=1 Tax=Cylicocyclus nassatus TaxID=53992 RepID=A0AA36GXQ5_CYLNA|nr:unnamed protein product [Cylicocyclus nassatus]
MMHGQLLFCFLLTILACAAEEDDSDSGISDVDYNGSHERESDDGGSGDEEGDGGSPRVEEAVALSGENGGDFNGTYFKELFANNSEWSPEECREQYCVNAGKIDHWDRKYGNCMKYCLEVRPKVELFSF